MRLFFALWPPAEAAAELARWAAQLQLATRGKATRVDTVHLTLAFLGEVDPARLPAAAAAAREVRGSAHSLPIDEARYWAHNRIVWAGPREMPAPLAALAAELHAALSRAGFALEARPFQAHITLIRKAATPRELRPPPAVDWPVREFVLVRSEPASEGSRYAIVERFALARR